MTMPRDPHGTALAVDLVIPDAGWAPYVEDPTTVVHGQIDRIGVLPAGMKSGLPSAAILITLDDGRRVIAETSWRNLSLAAVALIAQWGTP